VLRDPDTNRQYDVALQAGATDDCHFLRTIEFWGAERKRTPWRRHFAVLIAEDISFRFLRIAGVLNPAIPLVVLRVDATTLRFTRLEPRSTDSAGAATKSPAAARQAAAAVLPKRRSRI
jgi:hypothetical protein